MRSRPGGALSVGRRFGGILRTARRVQDEAGMRRLASHAGGLRRLASLIGLSPRILLLFLLPLSHPPPPLYLPGPPPSSSSAHLPAPQGSRATGCGQGEADEESRGRGITNNYLGAPCPGQCSRGQASRDPKATYKGGNTCTVLPWSMYSSAPLTAAKSTRSSCNDELENVSDPRGASFSTAATALPCCVTMPRTRPTVRGARVQYIMLPANTRRLPHLAFLQWVIVWP